MTAILNEIGAVFIPVRDIHAARNWYRDLLSIRSEGEVLFGHLYVVPMSDGSGLVLDSKDFTAPHTGKPVFHFNTRDIHAAFAEMGAKGVELVTGVIDGMFFNFKDPDGNLLMMADVPPAQKGR